jgi:MinD-like ATPase involved in chromosome partitioning or flagellar assembly
METITFYSYKGGVGRTLSLANIAIYLSRFGLNVCIVDFDLEAPGVHYKLKPLFSRPVERGLVDYIYEFTSGGNVPASLSEYALTAENVPEGEGNIRLIPAGNVLSAEYWKKLASIDWHGFFYESGGEGIPFFLEFKEKIRSELQPDFLLIDSRTGITEMSGICTALLPDRVVFLITNNPENIEGSRQILRGIQKEKNGDRQNAFLPITEETAYLIFKQTEGSPFYISSLVRSRYRHKDLTTVKGLTDTLEFETLNRQGYIKAIWMEYVLSTFKKVNGKNAKQIVLYLCQHRDREVTREELLEKLPLDLDDSQLEAKLEAMVKGDIISQGVSKFRYRGVTDNIFDKVFRGVYEEEIRGFDVRVIKKEYSEELEKLKKQYDRLLGKFNYQKGYFAEYLILERLRLQARQDNELLKSITRYLPG